MMRSIAYACLLASATCAWTQTAKPDLAGTWTINAARSNYGRMPPPKSYVETIEQKGGNLSITSVSEDQNGVTKGFLKLTLDDRDNVNEVNGNEFHSKSHWDGAKLITTVTGDKGLRMVEVRSLSSDGKTQTVETYFGEMRGTPQMTRVMDRK